MGEEYVEPKKKMMKQKPSSPHFVLIHGISHGAWCWYRIRCLLENSGFKVTCLDLKASGTDQTDANTILAFQDYNKPLLEFLSALPDDEQVILVGHSAGGLSVTDATQRFPKKVRLAVYIAATMLKMGFITEQDIKHGTPDLSEFGEFGDLYDIGYGLGPEQPPTSVVIKKSLQRKLLYHMSPQEDSTLASMLLRPGPVQALQSTQFENTDDEVDKVPRVYIRTTQDRVMKPEQQDEMIKSWPPSTIYDLETDHSPFFSAPFLLVGLLVKATASVGCV